MTNKEKKHNHFVPQVYLRNFAHTIEDKGKKQYYFVSTYDKIDQKENIKSNIDKICVKSKLYTLNADTKDKREVIENYYAGSFEKDYNKFYNIVIDETKYRISLEERALIIKTVIHLWARNVFWLNAYNDIRVRFIKDFESPELKNVHDKDGNVLFPFEGRSTGEIIKEDKKETQQTYIKLQLELTRNLLKYHSFDYIFVFKDKSDNDYITSDRPVINLSVAGPFFLPINKKTILCIIPNKGTLISDIMRITRGDNSLISEFECYYSTEVLNSCQYENANRIIIGNEIDLLRKTKNNYLNFEKP